ncbi:MAG: hypothetical protein ACI81C_003432, partial [Alteromonas macleodii]
MKHLTINPTIANNKDILAVIDAYHRSGTSATITNYLTSDEDLCPMVKAYLKGKFGVDEYGVFDIQIAFGEKVFDVLDKRVEQVLGRQDSLTWEFTAWVTGAYGEMTRQMREAY